MRGQCRSLPGAVLAGNVLCVQTCQGCGWHSHALYGQSPYFQNDQRPVVSSCQNSLYSYRVPRHSPHPIRGSMWLAERGGLRADVSLGTSGKAVGCIVIFGGATSLP